MSRRTIARLAAAPVALSLIATPAMAEKADRLTTLNGLPAEGVESALKSRGFKYIDSNTNSMGYTYAYWWDKDDGNCVRTETYRGTVETIVDASDADCHHSGGDGDAAAAVGIVAGAAILGALLSHKSNHHDDGSHYGDPEDEKRYENGYNAGLYNAPYNNKHSSSAYSAGYTAGVDQRNANLTHHSNRGGYVDTADFKDLRGARAAGGMDELARRGFTQVDNFTSGTARYSIQWRAASRQCVQVTIANGRFESVDDIHTHPKCRGGSGSGASAGSSDPGTWYGRLVGAASDGADVQMRNNGFRQVDSFTQSSGGHGSLWYNSSSRQCIELTTSHGRVDGSTMVPRSRCR